LLSGLAEGIGVVSLLPLLALVAGDGAADLGAAGSAIDTALGALGARPTVGTLLLMIVVGMAIKAVLVILAMVRAGYAAAAFGADLRLDLTRAIMGARWSYFTEQKVGEIGNAMSSEAARAASVFVVAFKLVAGLIQVLIYMALALLISWYVTVGAIVLAGGMFASLNGLVRMSRKAGLAQTDALKSLSARITDGMRAIKPLKAMAREDALQPLLEEDIERLRTSQERDALSNAVLPAVQEPLIVTFMALGLYVGLERLGLPFAEIVFLALLFQRVITRAGGLQYLYLSAVSLISAFWSIEEATQSARLVEESNEGTTDVRLSRAVDFETVSFSYGEQEVLRELSLSISAGSFTALVGPSGAGKTTIVDLIVGLHSPTQGAVRVDGVTLQEVDIPRWRSRIGYLPQDTVLFNDSIFVNVALGDAGIGRAEVDQALQAAGAEPFVELLPGGIDTVVGEYGAKLSGGQRQRLALARALVRKPDLLILDEATTALDPKTELAIAQTLRRLTGPMTILAISHQPTLTIVADVVYRIDEGRAKLTEGAAGA
jgi:ATP-binding cassette subfamily C protein